MLFYFIFDWFFFEGDFGIWRRIEKSYYFYFFWYDGIGDENLWEFLDG